MPGIRKFVVTLLDHRHLTSCPVSFTKPLPGYIRTNLILGRPGRSGAARDTAHALPRNARPGPDAQARVLREPVV